MQPDISNYFATIAQLAVTVVTFFGAIYIGRLQSTFENITNIKSSIIVDFLKFRENANKLFMKAVAHRQYLEEHRSDIEKYALSSEPGKNVMYYSRGQTSLSGEEDNEFLVMPQHRDLSNELKDVEKEIKRLSSYTKIINLSNLRESIKRNDAKISWRNSTNKRYGYNDELTYELWKISRRVDEMKVLNSPIGSIFVLAVLGWIFATGVILPLTFWTGKTKSLYIIHWNLLLPNFLLFWLSIGVISLLGYIAFLMRKINITGNNIELSERDKESKLSFF
jgi:hypothetical protein